MSEKSQKTGKSVRSQVATARLSKKTAPKKRVKSKASGTVSLPTNASLRAREKAALLRQQALLETDEWHLPMQQIAFTAGICFVVFGLFAASMNTFVAQQYRTASVTQSVNTPLGTSFSFEEIQQQVEEEEEELISSALPTQSTTTQTHQQSASGVTGISSVAGTQVATIDTEMEFELTTPPPSRITDTDEDYSFRFTLTNATNVRAFLRNVTTNSSVPAVSATSLSGDQYRVRFSTPQNFLAPGEYIISIFARNAITGESYQNPDIARVIVGSDDEVEAVATEPEPITPIVNPEPVNPGVGEPDITEEFSGDSFALLNVPSLMQGNISIGISAPEGNGTIDLYARKVGGQWRYLDSSQTVFSSQRFVFNVNEVFSESGQYEFRARTFVDGAEIRTETSTAFVRVTTGTTATTGSGGISDLVEVNSEPAIAPSPVAVPLPVPVEESDNKDQLLEGVDRTDNDVAIAVEEPTQPPVIETQVRDRIEENRDEVKEIVRELVEAKLSGDEEAVAAAEAAIEEKKSELGSVDDTESDDAIDEVLEEEIAVRVAEVVERTERFERVRQSRDQEEFVEEVEVETETNEQSTRVTRVKDSDNDGISDIDEINLFQTDPNSADSDGDGITDADELVRGLNPASSEPDAVIQFESPKESLALVQEEVLLIEEVVPVLKQRTEQPEFEAPEEVPVLSEIRGKALPDSFVTLFIFSSPIVVTIRTDADGSFVYTMDRELEDGQHDVYVAVTDNTGTILAQSNAFSFIKQAQAFTPVDAAEATVITNQSPVDTSVQDSFGTIAGLGILAFGLILLMLGIGLRSQQPQLASGRITMSEEEAQADEQASSPRREAKYKSEKKFDHIDVS